MNGPMKALTLWQPWATLISLGAKTIETRSWPTKYRGRLAIHAALKFPKEAQYLCFQGPFREILIDKYSFMRGGEIYFGKHKFPLGYVIATCRLVDVAPITTEPTIWISRNRNYQVPPEEPELSFGNYSPGRYAWLLDNITPLPEPIPARGAQGLWNWMLPEGFYT